MTDKKAVNQTTHLFEAVETYLKVLEKDPRNFEALFSTAEVLYKLNNLSEALEYSNKALEVQEDDVNALLLKGIILRDLGRSHESFHIFSRVLSSQSDNINALSQIAVLEMNRRQYEDALEKLDKILEIQPTNTFALDQRASINFQMGNYAEAQRDVDEALKLDPNSPGAFWIKGYLAASQLSSEALTKIKEIQMNLIKTHGEIVRKTQDNLRNLQDEFKSGFLIVMGMFIVSFVIGILLLLGAVYLGMHNQESIPSYIMGATGAGTLVISLITLSPERLQKNRVDFSQWMMSYFTWANAFFAINAYFTQEIQEKRRVEWTTVQDIQDYLSELTNETVMIVDECCEFKPESPIKANLLTDLFKRGKGEKEGKKPTS